MSDLTDNRKAIYEWAQGDAMLLSARCAKAEQTLDSARRRLLDIEGTFLGFWTDVPQSEVIRLLALIREELGDYEPAALTVLAGEEDTAKGKPLPKPSPVTFVIKKGGDAGMQEENNECRDK